MLNHMHHLMIMKMNPFNIIYISDLIQVGVNVPVFLCDSSKKEPSESGRAAGRAPAAMPVPCTNCTGFVFRNFSEDTI